MNVVSEELRAHVGPDESMKAVGSGRLVERDALAEEVTIGITDRRLLVVSEDGGFIGVGRESIASIRSRPTKSTLSRASNVWLLTAAGALLAVSAFIGVVVLASGALAPILALSVVAGIVSAEAVRRVDADPETEAPRGIADELVDAVADSELYRSLEDRFGHRVDAPRLARLGGVVVSLLAVVAFVSITGLMVLFLTVAAVGGIAVVDYAHRHERALRDARSSEDDRLTSDTRELSIYLRDDRAIHLLIDSRTSIDRKLCRFTYAASPESRDTGVIPS